MGTPRKYTVEMLSEAAANSSSLTGVLQFLGAPLTKGAYSYVGKRLRDLGVDTTHFPRGRRYTREVLSEAVAHSDSVAGVLRFLGLVQAGGTQSHVSRMIMQMSIDTSHFRRDLGGRMRANRLAASDILVWAPTAMKRQGPHRLRRALIEIGREYACESCACNGIWQGAPLTLHVDHVSGDFRDNRADNLRFLCPNCHPQTPNFAGRSKGTYSRLQPLTDVSGAEDAVA